MRWQDLFADLEREWEALAVAGRQAEIAERTRAELARVTLLDRMRGSEGLAVRATTRGGRDVEGVLVRVGADFALMDAPRTEVLVPIDALASMTGLGDRVTAAYGPVTSTLGLRSALRGIAADRSVVTVSGAGGEHTGTVQRVGADFLEIAEHPADEVPRRDSVHRARVVPFAAVDLLRRATTG